MGRFSMTYGALWVESTHDGRAGLEALQDPGDHIHGEVEISIDGVLLPALGFFGPDDVCVNTWLAEIWQVVAHLSADEGTRYVFDEGEQGQTAYAFERSNDHLLLSVIDGAGGGKADPAWQEVGTPFDEFVSQVGAFTSSLRTTLNNQAGDRGKAWLIHWTDPAIAAAVSLGNLPGVRVLLANGFRPDAIDRLWTESPIMKEAIAASNHQLIELLANHGADVELASSAGTTALHRAAGTDVGGGLVRTLLRCGADIAAVDSHGWTALHHAAVYGMNRNVRLLLDEGADVLTKTNAGLTPADLALQNNHDETAAALHETGGARS